MGWLFGFWGAFLWILFVLKFIDYPGGLHPDIMVGGFLLSFASGFITTASPKFTDSYPPTEWDLRLSVIFTSLLFSSLITPNVIYFRSAVLAQFLFLSWFVIQRVIHRKTNPPVVFLFILFGLFCGVLGMILLITNLSPILGRLLFLQGFILSFILGIGSRMVPALLGHEQTNFKFNTIITAGVIFFLSFVIESFYSVFLGTSLRNIIFLLVAFKIWKIHKLPVRRGFQAWGIWLSAWSMLIGALAASFFPSERIHLLHMLFVSGIGMLTLMIATRVSLSHGKHDMNLEMKSKHLVATVSLIILAGLTRSTAGFMPKLYEHHLAYAALVWIMGLLVWGWVFLPKIFKIEKTPPVKRGVFVKLN
jgi:uncharacterized protein involved in response to NO